MIWQKVRYNRGPMSEKLLPSEQDEIENSHYADKGSHNLRSSFWAKMRRFQPGIAIPDKVLTPDRVESYLRKRKMMRSSKDGR